MKLFKEKAEENKVNKAREEEILRLFEEIKKTDDPEKKKELVMYQDKLLNSNDRHEENVSRDKERKVNGWIKGGMGIGTFIGFMVGLNYEKTGAFTSTAFREFRQKWFRF